MSALARAANAFFAKPTHATATRYRTVALAAHVRGEITAIALEDALHATERFFV